MIGTLISFDLRGSNAEDAGLRRSVRVGQHQAAGLIVGRQSDEAGPNADEQRLDHLSFSRQTWDE
jgi:hypothetical protein